MGSILVADACTVSVEAFAGRCARGSAGIGGTYYTGIVWCVGSQLGISAAGTSRSKTLIINNKEINFIVFKESDFGGWPT
jgi:hypothetical protein